MVRKAMFDESQELLYTEKTENEPVEAFYLIDVHANITPLKKPSLWVPFIAQYPSEFFNPLKHKEYKRHIGNDLIKIERLIKSEGLTVSTRIKGIQPWEYCQDIDNDLSNRILGALPADLFEHITAKAEKNIINKRLFHQMYKEHEDAEDDPLKNRFGRKF